MGIVTNCIPSLSIDWQKLNLLRHHWLTLPLKRKCRHSGFNNIFVPSRPNFDNSRYNVMLGHVDISGVCGCVDTNVFQRVQMTNDH